jgi:hypothetical protein
MPKVRLLKIVQEITGVIFIPVFYGASMPVLDAVAPGLFARETRTAFSSESDGYSLNDYSPGAGRRKRNRVGVINLNNTDVVQGVVLLIYHSYDLIIDLKLL